MKYRKLKIAFLSIAAVLLSLCTMAQTEITVRLPEPTTSGGMPLMDALRLRESIRSFGTAEISEQHLSDLLWSAFGVSRPEKGLRTAPSARNWQDIDIYVVMSNGWYLYDHTEHALVRKGKEDLRAYTGTQSFVSTAPVNIVFVSDHSRMGEGVDEETRSFYASNHAGYISQNIYLYCTSAGLATVVRGLIDRENIREVLRLSGNQQVIFAQTVGYPGR